MRVIAEHVKRGDGMMIPSIPFFYRFS